MILAYRTILYLALGGYFLYDYFKRKKVYKLLIVFVSISALLASTPLLQFVGKTIEYIWGTTLFILVFVIIYLHGKDIECKGK